MSFIGSRAYRLLLGGGILGAVGGLAAGISFYVLFMRDLPDLRRIEDYRPALTSVVLDREGRLIGELYEERRRLVPIAEIPRHVQLAFVAGEDSSFFDHKGLDYTGILRAALANLRAGGEIKQGASTITQQMVKGLLLSPERTYRRKIREMVLARQIEEHFTKDEILYLYVNQIYFGQGAWGIDQAARVYFGKPVRDLGVSESAMLAGLVQRPSDYSPYHNPDAAERRRRYVLGRMLDNGFIDSSAHEEALANPPVIQGPPDADALIAAAHFTELLRRYLFERLGGEHVLRDGLVIETTLDRDLQLAAVKALRAGLEEHDRRQGWRGPERHVDADEIDRETVRLGEENAELLRIAESEPSDEEPLGDDETTEAPDIAEHPADPEIDPEDGTPEPGGVADVARLPAAEGESEPEAKFLPEIPFGEPMLGVVTKVDAKAGLARVSFAPEVWGEVRLEDVDWARDPNPKTRPRPVTKISRILGRGDVASFVRLEDLQPDEDVEADSSPEPEDPDAEPAPVIARLGLHQIPIVEGSLLSLDNGTGDVLALVGGYDYQRSEFNRATQAQRQPGSAFKPFIYGAALEKGYTPVSEVVDRPVVYTDPVSGFVWAPRNYGRHFYGPMPMRNALKKSINNATVHLFHDVGVDFVIDYARRFGIQSELSRDLSLALGSSSVTLLELTTAYAVFPNKGRRVVPRFIRRVTSRDGQVLLEDVPLGPVPPPVLRRLLVDAGGTGAETRGDFAAGAAYPDAEIMPSDQVISEAAAFLMTDLLKAVVQEGTGRRLKTLGRPLAGKTGTTNEQGDAWFMGFSPEITTGVWVGHDDNHVLGFGETGAGAALPIWKGFMAAALAGRPIRDFDVPSEHIVFARIDMETGLVADAAAANAYFQPFIEGTEPQRGVSDRQSAASARQALRDDVF
ncbi:MAG: PBP1A family penicillin-binding protein [Deltaproteobacteria bacterium]|nr:PBP1A family penicillin-binding protein [Deltaproteobacteria bacterium]